MEAAMARVFPPFTNTLARYSLLALLLGGAGGLWGCLAFARSSYGTGAGIACVQPVPFSHEHHVGRLQIDCRYCHGSVERSAYAGMPTTRTCMNCHQQIWVGSETLEPVRASYRSGESLAWKRIHNLPGFVYFEHSIHVRKGVGCTSCHGKIDEMPFTYQSPSLLMQWCLDCHRKPEEHLRPRAEVFNVRWRKPADQLERGRELAKEYRVRDARHLTSCSVCHR